MRAKRSPFSVGFSLVIAAVFVAFVILGRWRTVSSQAPEQRALNLFHNFRADFLATAESIEADQKISYVDKQGVVNPQGYDLHVVSAYRDLMQKVGGTYIKKNEDRSVDFGMYHSGLGFLPDSQIGIRFRPSSQATPGSLENPEIIVSTLSEAALTDGPQRASTLTYLVPIESEWFVFRAKYR